MNNTNIIIAILSVCSSVISVLIYCGILHIVCCKKENYIAPKRFISFNDVVKIDLSEIRQIYLNYDKWYIRITNKNKDECDIHFYKTRRCRRIMVKIGSMIVECYNAYQRRISIPIISDKLYNKKLLNNKAFIVVNKTKAFITEKVEVK
jgi:hypothetical protein